MTSDSKKTSPSNPATTPAASKPVTSGGVIPQEPMMPLWEVFVRPRTGLNHKHVGSLHAADSEMAINAARDVYTRREEGNSIWVTRSEDIVASDPGQAAENFEPAADKVYRHPSFYDIPDDIGHM